MLRWLLGAGLAVSTVLATVNPAAAAGPLGGPALLAPGQVVPAGAPPVPAAAVAHGWLVADLDTGAVLGARDAHGRYAPASTLKVLTALALLPVLDPGRKVVPTFDDVAVDGTKVGLVERVSYPVRELFTAMLTVSGNDAAMTLATAAGGQQEAVALMNREAVRLQARDTRAQNPSGLDAPGQTSSPYDLGLLARAAMQRADFRAYVSTLNSSVGGPGGKRIPIYNHDKLLTRYRGALGIKNGYTTAAQASFVGAARRDGRTLLVVVMRTRPRLWDEAAALLDWGFAAEKAGVHPVGQLVDPLPDPSARRAPAAATVVPRAAAPTPAGGSPLPGGLAAAAVVVGGMSLLRRRRRLARRQQARRAALRRSGPGVPLR